MEPERPDTRVLRGMSRLDWQLVSEVFVIVPGSTRHLAPDVLDNRGRLRVMPAAYWATTTPAERALFGHRHGLYSFPTVELVDHLREVIAGRVAIEIGAG